MTRQIQIRRGTAAEHANFTGVIGEVTMDTTNKTLRVHDGTTAGGTILAKQSEIPDIANADYVTEWQTPNSENDYVWYRKYKSGWVEQGGIISGNGTNQTITLPVEYASQTYSITIGNISSSTDGRTRRASGITSQTATSFVSYTPNGDKKYWEAKGIGA